MSEEHQHGPTNDGTVMVDIGGEMGALVILTPADLVHEEIEISAIEGGPQRVHMAVRERVGRNRPPRYGAVFPSLPQGIYSVWREKGGTEEALRVTIVGGHVAEVSWPTADWSSGAPAATG